MRVADLFNEPRKPAGDIPKALAVGDVDVLDIERLREALGMGSTALCRVVRHVSLACCAPVRVKDAASRRLTVLHSESQHGQGQRCINVARDRLGYLLPWVQGLRSWPHIP